MCNIQCILLSLILCNGVNSMKWKPKLVVEMEIFLWKEINPRQEQQIVIEILRAWIQINKPNLLCKKACPNWFLFFLNHGFIAEVSWFKTKRQKPSFWKKFGEVYTCCNATTGLLVLKITYRMPKKIKWKLDGKKFIN